MDDGPQLIPGAAKLQHNFIHSLYSSLTNVSKSSDGDRFQRNCADTTDIL